MTDEKMLREKIEKCGFKLTYVAEQVGITYQGLLNKMKNKTEFKCSEIRVLSSLLQLTKEEQTRIFFYS